MERPLPPGAKVDASVSTKDMESSAEEEDVAMDEDPPSDQASRETGAQTPVGATKTGFGVTATCQSSLFTPSAGTQQQSKQFPGSKAAFHYAAPECKTAMPPPASSSMRGCVRVLSPDDDTAGNESPSLPPAAKQPKRSASTPLSRESSAIPSAEMERTPSVSSTLSEPMGTLTSSSSDATSCDTSCDTSSSSSLSLQSTAVPWDPSRFRPPLNTDRSQSSGLPTPSEWIIPDPAAARGSASSAVSAGPHAPLQSPVSFGQGISEYSSVCKPVARYPESKAPLFGPLPTRPDSSASLHTAAERSGTPFVSTSARGQFMSQEEAGRAPSSLLQHSTARDDSHSRRPTDAAFRAPPTAGVSGGVEQAAHTERPPSEIEQDSDEESHSSDEYR